MCLFLAAKHKYLFFKKMSGLKNVLRGAHHESTLDILYSSNHNIHKSFMAFLFWASDTIIEGF